MKLKLLFIATVIFGHVAHSQLIQGSIEKATANSVNVWLKPNFSNSTEYLYQIGLPIAFPASFNPSLSDLTVTLDPGFVSAFGNNYSVGIAPLAHNTANTVKYFFVYLVRGAIGTAIAQTWTSGTAFKVLNISFANSDSLNTAKIKLADFQDGGSDGQGNFYTVSGSAKYYVASNSVNNFYSISGLSASGGNSSEGYAETTGSIFLTSSNTRKAEESVFGNISENKNIIKRITYSLNGQSEFQARYSQTY